jgi:hypothetical protein
LPVFIAHGNGAGVEKNIFFTPLIDSVSVKMGKNSGKNNNLKFGSLVESRVQTRDVFFHVQTVFLPVFYISGQFQ